MAYAFKHLKHPSGSIDFITADSLRRALNVYDFKDVPDHIVTLMMEMAVDGGAAG